jgi:hypothetical protein
MKEVQTIIDTPPLLRHYFGCAFTLSLTEVEEMPD